MEFRVDQHRSLLLAVGLTIAYHGGMVFYTFSRTYDAYVHIFFADHYRRSWFDHWEYRWYTGFPMISYPPGSQQSVALLSTVTGLTAAFAIVQVAALVLCVIGIYRFSRIWVSAPAAGYAALIFVFSSSITETVHVFGQLPTTFSLGFLLNTAPYMYRWLMDGRPHLLLLAWSWNAATTAGHHVTTLFGAVFFLAPVMALAILEKFRDPLPDESPVQPLAINRSNLRPLIMRRFRRILPVVLRSAVYGVGMIGLLVLVVLPYWIWSVTDPINQVAIPHASRDSYLANPAAGLIFWLVPWGVTLVAFPYAVYKGLTTRVWPMTLSLLLLALLGTGGTTPIPRLLLRGAYEVLTLDRFTFWATIAILPLVGEFAASLVDGRLARYLTEQFSRPTWRAIQFGLALALILFSLLTANLTRLRTFQPDPIDPDPIVRFIDKDEHWKWRYLTLGFGDQVAWLSAQTTATSVDGNYHSARRLPELTTTPVERLEGAKFRGIPGIGSLQQFLAVPEKYNLKFVFSNDQFYDPLLYFSGWHRLGRLENGIMVWEREDIPPLPEVLPRKEIPLYQRLLWGLLPMGAIGLALLLTGLYLLRRPLLLLLDAVDLTAFLERGGDRLQRPFRRIWDNVDRRLGALAVIPDEAGGGRLKWLAWWDRLAAFSLPRPAAPSARLLRSILLGGILLAPAGGFLLYWHAPLPPEAVVVAYFDDLDFRRFDEAYAALDPLTRPGYEQFILNLTAAGGLLASYAKLDAVHTARVESAPGRVTVRADLRWVTSLALYDSTTTLTLIRRDNTWFISPPAVEAARPPDPFMRQGVVAWHAQGRRRNMEAETDLADIQDRPELEILSARLVERNGRLSVVGELINTDVDPADITVSAYLFDSTGNPITWYNAQQVIMHKILPKETTPFRIDFEGIAGAALEPVAEFDPTAFTAVNFERPPAAFEVYAKAVVTPHDLHRIVAVREIAACPPASASGDRCPAGDGWTLTGTLTNNGTIEAIIPQLLLTYYDAEGAVTWVDAVYLEQSIRPQRHLPFQVTIPPVRDVRPLISRGSTYANRAGLGLETMLVRDDEAALRLPLPPGSGFAAVKLQVNLFVLEH